MLAHLDFGRARPYFATVSARAFFGSMNFIILRRSTSRLRKKDSTNLRADESERLLYISAVIARGIDAKASGCRTAGRVGVLG